MKEKQEKKLRLNKITVQNLDFVLDRVEQKQVKGGSVTRLGTTEMPIFC